MSTHPSLRGLLVSLSTSASLVISGAASHAMAGAASLVILGAASLVILGAASLVILGAASLVILGAASLVILGAASLALTGCGVGPAAVPSPVSGTLALHGLVHGGQQPVSFSTVTLYAVGSGGYGTAATSKLVLPVITDSGGNFNISGDYSCTNANDQLYIVAHGGNPGLALGTNNQALTLVALLGTCSAAPSIPNLLVDEVTTVAAAYTLAPFVGSDYAHVGTSTGNAAGVVAGMAGGRQIVDITTGLAATLPANVTTEPAKIDSFANALASCANTAGGSGCAPLFAATTPPGGSAPTDTFMAAVNVVRHPGQQVAAIYNLATAFAPYPGLSSAPNDWTLSQTSTGNGLNSPTYLAVDKAGNVLVANFNGPLSAFTPAGLAIGTFVSGDLGESYGMTIDRSDKIWITLAQTPVHGNTQGGVAGITGMSSSSPGTYQGIGYNNGVDFPSAVSTDLQGSIYIANNGNSTATVWHDTDTSTYTYGSGSNTTSIGSGSMSFPVAIAADGNSSSTFPGSFWVANFGDNSITHIDSMGNVLAHPNCCMGANGIAVDQAGNAWAPSYYNSQLSEVSPTGAFTARGGTINCTGAPCNGGLYYPAADIIDGAQEPWIVNYRGTSFSHFAGIASQDAGGNTIAAGAPLSPESVYDSKGNLTTQGGFGLDAGLLLPFAIGTDASGNVWISSYGNNKLVKFFGLAAPTMTPTRPVPVKP